MPCLSKSSWYVFSLRFYNDGQWWSMMLLCILCQANQAHRPPAGQTRGEVQLEPGDWQDHVQGRLLIFHILYYFIELSIDIVKYQNMSDVNKCTSALCREVLTTPANPLSGWSWSPSTTSTTRRLWRPSHPRYTSSCSQSCSLKRWVICHHTLYPSLTLFIDIKYSSFSAGLDYSDLSQVGGDPRSQQGQDLGRGINNQFREKERQETMRQHALYQLTWHRYFVEF